MNAKTFRPKLAKVLSSYKKMSLAKYDRGRKEHGDSLEELDLFNEFLQEHFDLLDYFLMLNEKYQEAIKELQRLRKEEGKCSRKSQRYLAG